VMALDQGAFGSLVEHNRRDEGLTLPAALDQASPA
jgi:hypothetical protein